MYRYYSMVGEWAHSACVMWIPETGFDDVVTMNKVIGVKEIESDRRALVLC